MSEWAWLSEVSAIAAVVAIVNLVAMMVDLGSGLYKAKLRKELTTSFGLHRTTIKAITYLGSVLIGYGIDVLLHMGRAWQLVGWDLLVGVPVVAILIGAFNCVVELVSVREKASSKADKRAMGQLVAIIKTFSRDEVRRMLEAVGKIQNEGSDGNTEEGQ